MTDPHPLRYNCQNCVDNDCYLMVFDKQCCQHKNHFHKPAKEISDKVLEDFGVWIKTEWVQESIKDYKEELRTKER